MHAGFEKQTSQLPIQASRASHNTCNLQHSKLNLFLPLNCSQLHNDNILLFTDGMANEGFTDSDELIREIQKKKQLVRQECRYPEDYSIKIATLGQSTAT